MASVLLRAGTTWDIYWSKQHAVLWLLALTDSSREEEIDDCLAFLFPANLFCFYISPFSPPLALLYIYDTTLESLPVHIHFITSCTIIISCFLHGGIHRHRRIHHTHTQRHTHREREEMAYTHEV
ncbi:hypothetical protein HDV57DRAFT_374038 [Trichoderma longibrachiatum]|uniref:Uncharacterized protein n=1 Tax=Trichoderma longibrachiatum ATCC 18648 TaxID=983965 RepID=A0A2T4BQ99_TRILO|nr:hypothetical protein M440DRAFT_214561 [Trichoderma longibrachiatum ATCC 18648]